MSLWNKNELLTALKNNLIEYKLDDNLQIDEFVIDSREKCKNGLFLAINGENNDGHKFISSAKENGCTSFIIDNPDYKNDNYILVKDSLEALNILAKFSRNRSNATIIAITGSVGKTTTKELLKQVFQSQGKVFATKGNLNNHIGVPLSLCNFAPDCEFGIFEMGMNHLGEIEPLSQLVKPELALITNVGPVHIEFFKDEEEIALAKSEIFAGLQEYGIALINQDNQHYNFLQKQASKRDDVEIMTFGQKNDDSIYQILEVKNSNNISTIKAKISGNSEISYQISSLNEAVISNSIIAVACLDLLGNDLEKGLKALNNISDASGRGKIEEITLNNKKITLIDDSYNASLPSIISGINYAKNIKRTLNKKRLIIALGDMLELGEKSAELHSKIIPFLDQVDLTILVGNEMSKLSDKLNNDSCKKYATSIAANDDLKKLLEDGDLLYIKGSRGMKMEQIINK